MMTHDEVLALSVEELRGWAWTLAYCENPTRNMVNMNGEAEIANATILVPDYPNDIAASMELVEIAYTHRRMLFNVGRVHDEPTRWHADFFLLKSVCPWNEPYNELSQFYRMFGSSTEKAITRAFVLAMKDAADAS